MKKILLITALAYLAAVHWAQSGAPLPSGHSFRPFSLRADSMMLLGVGQGSGSSPSTYTFVTYTYVAESSGSPTASITSPALTLTAADFIFVFCRTAASSTVATTFSSSPSNTWVALSQQFESASSGTGQAGYALSAGAGSTTFTCTPASSQSYQSMVVLQYHHSGVPAVFNSGTDLGGVQTAGTTITSPTVSTSAAALVIYCATSNNTGQTYSGTIGANTGTIRGVSGASNGTGDSGCEDTIFSTSESSIDATMTGNNYQFIGGGGAFN